jgi:thymidylate synthase (FAD)|nr:MAG TPA: Thymidylate synthase complementing protein [Caudoviricetes sp.]
MIIVKKSVEIINPPSYMTLLNMVERASRNCYQSEDKITDVSAEKIIRFLINNKHFSMLEFANLTFKMVMDRATAMQLTRHRMCTFAIESTRYCNYNKTGEIRVIAPEGLNDSGYDTWYTSVIMAEVAYMKMIQEDKMSAEVSRSVLPQCLATTVFMHTNIRELRHILSLRLDKHAQKDIRVLMQDILEFVYKKYPVFFEDIYAEYSNK